MLPSSGLLAVSGVDLRSSGTAHGPDYRMT